MSKIGRKITIEGHDNEVEFVLGEGAEVYVFIPDTNYDAKAQGYGFGATVSIDKLVEAVKEIEQWQRDKVVAKLLRGG
jgi:hypothetical protein